MVLDDLHLTLQTGAGDVNILRGFAMTVARCETVAVVGPSGSGKSTMLAVMAGLQRATSGRVTVAAPTVFQRDSAKCNDPVLDLPLLHLGSDDFLVPDQTFFYVNSENYMFFRRCFSKG